MLALFFEGQNVKKIMKQLYFKVKTVKMYNGRGDPLYKEAGGPSGVRFSYLLGSSIYIV